MKIFINFDDWPVGDITPPLPKLLMLYSNYEENVLWRGNVRRMGLKKQPFSDIKTTVNAP